jgi:hypothetical protein
MNAHLAVRIEVPHRDRLAALRAVAQRTISLYLGTFWATPRRHVAPPVGCLLGHYVRECKPAHLDLVPLNFLEQIKAPINAQIVLNKYPNSQWQHHTLRYHGPDVEAWGLSAACLYFRIRPWDCQRMFWPNGTNYQLEVPSNLVLPRLDRFLDVAKTVEDSP